MDYAIKIVEQSGKDLTDYQIRVEITDEEFFNKCTDQKFVEFYDEDKQTLLSHYTELFDTANKKAIFWVKVPSITANGTKYIYLNINTSRTEDLSDPEAVFNFWDDFEGMELDTTKWEINGNPTIEISNGIAYMTRDSAEDCIYTKQSFDFSAELLITETKAKWRGSGTGEGGIMTALDPSTGRHYWHYLSDWDDTIRVVKRSSYTDEVSAAKEAYSYQANVWFILKAIVNPTLNEVKTIVEDENGNYAEVTLSDSEYTSGRIGIKPADQDYDWIRVRKYTDPEPSVTVIKLGATPTYELKLKIAQALSGESDTILDTDPKLRLLSGTDIIKELSLTAKTVYKDSVNNRVVVAFLFVDDSSDSYTTDNQELLFTKDNVEYVAFKSSKSFTKEANKRLPLRWEIYLPYDVDVCTYEETMIGCL